MTPGKERSDATRAALLALGKPLARRAGSKCEVCRAGGRLGVVEVLGGPPEPDLEWTVLLCMDCANDLQGRGPGDADRLQCLKTAIWSNTPAVRITAARLSRRLANQGVMWALDLLDEVFLEDDVTGVQDIDGDPGGD